MADDSTTIELSRSELREVAGYAVACARPALVIFERERPEDRRPRAAIEAAQACADGGERTEALRDSAGAAEVRPQHWVRADGGRHLVRPEPNRTTSPRRPVPDGRRRAARPR